MLGALDTLQTVKRLKEAGFNEAQAEAMTEVLRDNREGTIADLATKSDIAGLKSEIDKLAAESRAEFASVRSEMALLRQEVEAKLASLEARIAASEAKFESKFASLEARIAGSEAKFESKLEILRRDMTIRLGSMLVVMTGILLAAKFFG
jgi:Flp pilus assembly secretin CpaC